MSAARATRPALGLMAPAHRLWRLLGLVGLVLVLALANTGCATVSPDSRNRADPWEGFNRRVFAVNDAVDTVLVRPAAEIYQRVLPSLVRTGIDNVYGNIGDAWSSVNLLLQAKPRRALEMSLRFGVNTVFGMLGLFDVAGEAGLERTHSEDFGQTLGAWGVKPGPYIVLPLLGPSTLRDAAGLTVDFNASGPGQILTHPADRNSAIALRLLSERVKLLTASKLLDDIALDKYVLLRDAYLARRRNQIYDGNPPDEDEPEPDAPSTAPSAPTPPTAPSAPTPPTAATK